MTIKNITTDIDVIAKYNKLIAESLGSDSVYIRAKETLQSMLDKGEITEVQKSEALAGLVGGINSAVMSSSMSTALQWATTEKELEIRKLELEKQLSILDEDKKLKEAQTAKTWEENYATQATSLRANGYATIVQGKVAALSEAGKTLEDTALVKQTTATKKAETALLAVKEREVNAGIHKVMADTYVNYGMFSGYDITSTGVTGLADITPNSMTTLSDLQVVIAKEQAKGYSYNAWANAATGLGSTIGAALASDYDLFSGANAGIMTDWSAVINKLKNIDEPKGL